MSQASTNVLPRDFPMKWAGVRPDFDTNPSDQISYSGIYYILDKILTTFVPYQTKSSLRIRCLEVYRGSRLGHRKTRKNGVCRAGQFQIRIYIDNFSRKRFSGEIIGRDTPEQNPL
jgi:hypothetical protein